MQEALLFLEKHELIVKMPYLEKRSDTICGESSAAAGDVSGGGGHGSASATGIRIGGTRLHPTLLGRATYLSSLPIRVGLEIYEHMSQGRAQVCVCGKLGRE